MKYEYQPVKFPKFKLPWENTLFLGIELELEFNGQSEDNPCGCGDCDECYEWEDKDEEEDKMQAIEKIDSQLKKINNDIFFYKDDGSLNYGTEFVSSPFTLLYSNRMLKFKEILKIISDQGFFSDQNAGLHVHISKSFFDRVDMEKIRIFFSVNQKDIFKFSGRSNINNRYSAYENYSLHDFLYGGRRLNSSKSCACNLDSYHPTIEIRAFNSTTDYKKMKAVLHFCDAISNYMKDISLIGATKKDGWKLFLEWCKTKNRYDPFLNNLGV